MVQNDEQAVDERAEKITKYLALARSLRTDSSESDYRLANSLAWELALWMPTDFYRLMGQALCKPALFNDFIIAVRRGELKGQAGDLAQDPSALGEAGRDRGLHLRHRADRRPDQQRG